MNANLNVNGQWFRRGDNKAVEDTPFWFRNCFKICLNEATISVELLDSQP